MTAGKIKIQTKKVAVWEGVKNNKRKKVRKKEENNSKHFGKRQASITPWLAFECENTHDNKSQEKHYLFSTSLDDAVSTSRMAVNVKTSLTSINIGSSFK